MNWNEEDDQEDLNLNDPDPNQLLVETEDIEWSGGEEEADDIERSSVEEEEKEDRVIESENSNSDSNNSNSESENIYLNNKKWSR